MVGEDYDVKCAGFLVAKELDNFSKVLTAPEKPVLAILGGAKVWDKILLIKNMCSKVDQIIIGRRGRRQDRPGDHVDRQGEGRRDNPAHVPGTRSK